jgi:predicted AAA+ superfamily ATPase
MAPELFPTLKEFVRVKKTPGQFLLSGSVRFTSKKSIQESLTGRILSVELLPITISEMAHQELPKTLNKILNTGNVEKVLQSLEVDLKPAAKLEKEYKYYLSRGGLPGSCFINNDNLRNLKIRERLSTILDRDIRMIHSTNLSLNQLTDFLRFIANSQGEEFSYAAAQRNTQISPITQKKLLYSFESAYLIRRLPVEGGAKGHAYYLEDQGESYSLMDQNDLNSIELKQQLIYRNLRAQLYYDLGSSFRESFYLTRSGAKIPYVIEKNNFKIAVKYIFDKPTRSDIATAESFLKKHDQSRVLLLSESKTLESFGNRIIQAPLLAFV